MPRRRGIEPERDKNEGGSAKAVLRFFVRQGEKFVLGAVVVIALLLVLQTGRYQPLSWRPGELEELANSTEETIKSNNFTVDDKEIRVFDYATYAELIRETIFPELYRGDAELRPVLRLAPQPRGGFEILAAKFLRGEPARQAGLTTQEKPAARWQRPPLPGIAAGDQHPVRGAATIWVNLYGTIPVWEQWDIYNQVFGSTDPANRPEYVYYELERTEITLKEVPVWQPVTVYSTGEFQTGRLIPFGQQQEALQDRDLLLFSDFDVEPAKTYAYRMRLYVRNPNYNAQETSVKEGVDTTSELVRSDWSFFARVYVPGRTLVQLQSVTPTDPTDFPRQTVPLGSVRGTLVLDYFDVELGQSLPLVEKRNVLRGMLGNMTRDEANRFINRGDSEIVVNYPDAGLRSNVCVMDFSGGRELQKRRTREAQASPELFVPGRALLLMPDGTMQITSTEPELFR